MLTKLYFFRQVQAVVLLFAHLLQPLVQPLGYTLNSVDKFGIKRELIFNLIILLLKLQLKGQTAYNRVYLLNKVPPKIFFNFTLAIQLQIMTTDLC